MYLSGKFYGIKRTFTIQKMDLDTKNLSNDIKAKELEAYWNKECE